MLQTGPDYSTFHAGHSPLAPNGCGLYLTPSDTLLCTPVQPEGEDLSHAVQWNGPYAPGTRFRDDVWNRPYDRTLLRYLRGVPVRVNERVRFQHGVVPFYAEFWWQYGDEGNKPLVCGSWEVWETIDRFHGRAPDRAILPSGEWHWVANSYYDGTGRCLRLVGGNASQFTMIERE